MNKPTILGLGAGLSALALVVFANYKEVEREIITDAKIASFTQSAGDCKDIQKAIEPELKGQAYSITIPVGDCEDLKRVIFAKTDNKTFDISSIEDSVQILIDYYNSIAQGENPQYRVVFRNSIWEVMTGMDYGRARDQAIEFERVPE